MFGQNPIRKIDHNAEDGNLAVQEIFYTIQGEGPLAGTPAVFIRLAGCHLACTFCDTEFESGINNRLPVEAIVGDARRALQEITMTLPGNAGGLVVITGGEPLRQTTGPLVAALLAAGFEHVQFETAGNLWDESLIYFLEDARVSLVCSPKTPRVHPMIARYCRDFKYVVRTLDAGADGLPISPTQAHQGPNTEVWRPWDSSDYGPKVTVWVSPCDEHDEAKNKANVEHATAVAMRHGYRLSLQTHKLVGLP